MGNKFKSRRLACEDASLRRENVQQDAKVWETSLKADVGLRKTIG